MIVDKNIKQYIYTKTNNIILTISINKFFNSSINQFMKHL